MLARFIINELPLLKQVIYDSRDLIKYYHSCKLDIPEQNFIDWAKNVYSITDNQYYRERTDQEIIFNALSANILHMTIFSITTRPVEKLKYLIGLSLLHKLTEPLKIYLKIDFYRDEFIQGISEIFYIFQYKQMINIDIASDIGVIQNNCNKYLGKLRCKQLQQDVSQFTQCNNDDSYSMLLRFYDRQVDTSLISYLNITTLVVMDLSIFDFTNLNLNVIQQLIVRNISWIQNTSEKLTNLQKLSLDLVDGIASQDFIFFKSLTHLNLSSIHNIQEVLTYLDGREILYLNLWNVQLSEDIRLVDKFLKCIDFIIRSCQIVNITLQNCLHNVQSLIVDCGRKSSEQSNINVHFKNISFYYSVRVLHLPDKTYDDINLNICQQLTTVHAFQATPSIFCRKSSKHYINLQSKILSIHVSILNQTELQSLIKSIQILINRHFKQMLWWVEYKRFNDVLLRIDQI